MNNKLKFLVVGLSTFVVGLSINNFAMSDVPSNCKIAVVDVSKVVNSSSQVAALKKEQQAKAQDLVKFVEKARKDVASTTDTKKKQALEDKYNKELKTKKEAMDKNYTTKLTAIDNSISNQINAQAKAGNYDIVLAKGVVLYGGTDITEAVIKAVK
ncbi:MAG: OmpH family outer membrane protein [Candidatus Gastranaerophilaceae bacterium]